MDQTATVIAAQTGDISAFEKLVNAQASVVCGIATAITGDPRSGEDVGQQVFLIAWQKLHTLANPASFAPWLRQLTRNRALDLRRRRAARPDVLPGDGALVDRAADPLDDLEQRLDAYRAEDTVWRVLDELPTDHREVLVLYYREGQRVKQVAQLLDLGEATVRKRLSRARGQLRDAVEARLAEGIRSTAPGQAFVVGVAALVAASAPGIAKAGTTVGLAGASAKLLASGAALGATGGLAGVWLGYRRARGALSADDGKRLYRHALIQGAGVVLAVGIMTLVPGIAGTLGAMTLLVAVMAGTMVRWPWSAARVGGTAVGLGLGTMGAAMGLAGAGVDLATALALHLQLYCFVALPIVLASAATWHLGLRWRTWFAGMASWLGALPVIAAGPALATALMGATPVAGAVGLSLAAGFGEEAARWVLFSLLWRLRGPVSGRNAILLSLGHGGVEALLFGAGALGMLAVQPEPMEAWAHALFGGSRALLLLCHVGFGLCVWRAVRDRAPRFLILAIAMHVALDLAAFAGPTVWPEVSMVVTGLVVAGWSAVSAWLVADAVRPTTE